MIMNLVDCHNEATKDVPPTKSAFKSSGTAGYTPYQAVPVIKAPEGPDVRGHTAFRLNGG